MYLVQLICPEGWLDIFSILSNLRQGLDSNASREAMNLTASKYNGGQKFLPEARGKLSITSGLISVPSKFRISM